MTNPSSKAANPREYSPDLGRELGLYFKRTLNDYEQPVEWPQFSADHIAALNDRHLMARIRQSLTIPANDREVRALLVRLDKQLQSAKELIDAWTSLAGERAARAQEEADYGARPEPAALARLNSTALLGPPEASVDPEWDPAMWPQHVVATEVVRLAAALSSRAVAWRPSDVGDDARAEEEQKGPTKRTLDPKTGKLASVPVSAAAVQEVVDALRPSLKLSDVLLINAELHGSEATCWVLGGEKGFSSLQAADWRALPVKEARSGGAVCLDLEALCNILFTAAMGREVNAQRSIVAYRSRQETRWQKASQEFDAAGG